MKKIVFLLFCVFIVFDVRASSYLDVIYFGNVSSEKKHDFKDHFSKAITGGLDETARVLMPIEGNLVEGGNITFTMKTDPERQNYFTVRLWGSDIGKGNVLILFCEGKQVGYRHLGDYDMIDISNNEQPFNNRFYYVTLPLPKHLTTGKRKIELSIHSTGPIWGYGETLEKYQKPMLEPSKGIYSGYTHTETYFDPPKKEKQGRVDMQNAPVRSKPDEQILVELKDRINKELDKLINKSTPLNQVEMWFLSEAYGVKWTVAYRNAKVPGRVVMSIDSFYVRTLDDPKLIWSDKATYNPDWFVTGPIAISIRYLYDELKSFMLEKTINDKTRKEIWTELMVKALEYSTTHRRQYTNQSMIIDLFTYHCNRALMLVDPDKALPQYQTLRYLYESVGLSPWLGSETPEGSQKPLGDNYMQMTAKGLTKELGFVGYYGEILDWMTNIYKATGTPGIHDSGDKKIKNQILKFMNARLNFRYPMLDNQGYRAMRTEAVVGWRDAGHYPGDVAYVERIGWDATPLMAAAATLDPVAVGVAQQMMDEDYQLFDILRLKMENKGFRVTQSLLHVPDDYELVKKQSKQKVKLPMSEGMPDYVFSDEEDGVIAVKNGEEVLYVSLYWRARYAINNLARIHYITPEVDRIATVFQETEFTDSGMRYKRPAWVNLGFGGFREFYPGIESAHTGEELPIAKIPDGVKFKPGDENIYAGKGDFYKLHYGKYLIGMNTTKDKTYQLEIPGEYKNSINLTDNKQKVKEKEITIKPMSTVVISL